jgi:hypothetical protein
MTWPSAVDYRDALQHPARVFSLPELRGCRVETNHLGVPRPRSGASAQVYKFFNSAGAIAVRVFLYPSDEREQHYRAVHDHLQTVRASSLVSFSYHPTGIQIDRGRFPVLTMDWVEGITLGEWMHQKVMLGDTAAIRRLADRWIELMRELRSARIAHGDLQHDNVLVVGETLKLVDYDGMCVPALVGQEARENGKPAYQHPEREGQPLSLELDDFSAWIILLALRAVAVEPRLWRQYVERVENENLLFTDRDLLEPHYSSLWSELLIFPDDEVRAWASRLHVTLPDKPFDSIPPFEIDYFAELRRVCLALPRDWRVIARLGQTPRIGERMPPELVAVIDEARKREDARRTLEEALRVGDPKCIAEAYHPQWLDDWPECASLVQRARLAGETAQALEELRRAIREPGDGHRLLHLWATLSPGLAGVPEADAIHREVERWRLRLEGLDRFRNALKGEREAPIASAWRQLEQAGGHPDAEQYRERAELAQSRSECLARLRAIGESLPADEQDRRWMAEWDEDLLSDCPEAVVLRVRYEKARDRLRAWAELELLLKSQDVERIAQAIVNPLLEGYPPVVRQQARIRDMIDRGPRIRRLVDRIQQSDPRTFEHADDRKCLRESPDVFAELRDWIAPPQTWAISAARLSAPYAPLEIVERGRGILVRWNWRSLDELHCCLLALGPCFFQTPNEPRKSVRVELEDYRRGGSGFLVPMPRGGGEVFVTIWPILELEWIELAGEPLHLGPIAPQVSV